MKFLPLVLFALVLVGLVMLGARTRRRQAAAEATRAAQLAVGSEVMTTSGLYATIVALDDDGTARLSVAPGVEVRWALAALRDVRDLPDRYRTGDAPDAPIPGAPVAAPPGYPPPGYPPPPVPPTATAS